jgi:glycerol kinase
VVFVPAFVGLGAPHWDPHASGDHDRLAAEYAAGAYCAGGAGEHRFQVADALEAMQQDSAAGTGTKLPALRVDGGAAVNDLMMQFQADVLGVPVIRPRVTETTALGAAYLAGLATGILGRGERVAGAAAERCSV